MFKILFDHVFKLPPVEQRRDIRDSFLIRIVNPAPPVNEKDDAYIYYQLARTSFMVMGGLAIPFLIAYSLEKTLFGISVPEGQSLSVVLAQYAEVSRIILIYFLFPFFLIKLRRNLNPKTYDVLWFSPGFPPYRPRKRWKVLSVAFPIFLIFWLCSLFMDVLPLWMFGFLYNESVFTLVVYMAITSYFLTLCTMFMFLATLWCWRYIGKYQGN